MVDLRLLMRRWVSIAVLMLLLSSAFAPLAQAWGASLPACCRVGGKHHCTEMAGMDGFQSLPGKCPHHVSPAVTTELAALLATGVPVANRSDQTKAVTPCSPEPAHVDFGNVQKRGPPLS